MASAAECATAAEAEPCCCSDEESEPGSAHADAPDCECPACACTIEAQRSPAPWAPITQTEQHELPSVLTAPALAVAFVAPLEAADAPVRPLRGPPDNARAPLYLLYDTLLI